MTHDTFGLCDVFSKDRLRFIGRMPGLPRRTSLTPRSFTDMDRREVRFNTNSPTDSTTANSSDTPTNDSSDTSQKIVFNPNHKIGYNDIVKILKEGYSFDENSNSTSLDILALYLKGQKIIYTESKTYCEKRLNSLMLPAILLAAVCSILNFILKDYVYGTVIISSLNACNSFILSVINYLKLAEKSQNHLMAAQRFHNLESRIELKSGRSLFFHDSVKIESALEDIEKEIKEIQSSDQFIVPEAIRYRYPKIFSSNIFSLVKEIKNDEMIIINKLKTAVQNIHHHTEEKEKLIGMRNELRNDIKRYNDELHALELRRELNELEVSDILIDTHIASVDENLTKNALFLANGDDITTDESDSDMEMPDCPTPNEDMDPVELQTKVNEWKEKYELFRKERKVYLDAKREEKEKRAEDRRRKSESKKNCLITTTKIKHTTIRLNNAERDLDAVNKIIEEEDYTINECELLKDKAFTEIVSHRQRYIGLSDDINREINQHILKTKKWWGCNPCDFLNT